MGGWIEVDYAGTVGLFPFMKVNPGEVLIVLVTVPSQVEARKISKFVVEEKFAACANVIPGIRSMYRWKGKVEVAQELLLILKTTRKKYAALEKAVKKLHPYEVPEIIGFRAGVGLPQYLGWVRHEIHH